MSDKLKEFQEYFLQCVHPGNKELPCEEAFSIIGAGKLSELEALQVYRSDYVLRMTEVLGEQFGGCWKVLGDDDFLALCESYIKEKPSRSKTLSHYGEDFPSYILEHSGHDFGFIGELASFEWNYQKLFHSSPDYEVLTQEQLLNGPILPKDSSFIVRSSFDLINIFQKKESYEELTWEDIDKGGLFVLYKEGFQVKFSHIPSVFLPVLEDFSSGKRLVDILVDYENDPRFSDLDQQQWASFFSVIMKLYKLK